MAMSLHLDDLDESRPWLDHMSTAAANTGASSRTVNMNPIVSPVQQYAPANGLNGGPEATYRRVMASARGRENGQQHKDSNTRLNAAFQNLQVGDNGIQGQDHNRNYTPSLGPGPSQPLPPLPPLPTMARRGPALPLQKIQTSSSTRSESLPPAGRRPTAALPVISRAGLLSSSRKGSGESGLRVRTPLSQTPVNSTEQVFETVLKSPTTTKRPKPAPKRRTQFNPEGDEIDEQRWRFHRDELFQSMEKAHWADASEHSDALAQISRDHGCVLSVNERYFFEKINGILLVAQRQSAAALRLAEKSNAENSNTLQLVKCIALMQLGDFKGAREACQPLFKIWSKDEVLRDQRTHYYLMAMILDRLGKKAEAKWYRQHIPENFRFDLWIESALSGLQTEPSERTLGQLQTEIPQAQSPSVSNATQANPPETPGSTRSDPPPFTPSDPAPPEYQVVPRFTAKEAMDTLRGFNLKYENGQVTGEEVAKKRAIFFFLTEWHGDKMYDCIRSLFSEQCCRGVIDVAENIWKCNSLGLIARNKGPSSGEMARFLLSLGDQPFHLDSSPDGFSALHTAAKEENFPVAESILNHVGIPIQEEVLSRHNLTPLHLAAEYNRKTLIVSLLLDAGSDVNARGGPLGNTPLHYAIRGYLHDPIPSRLETIDYLLESPYIKLGQKNNNKESAEEYAKLCTLSDLARRIKDMRKNGKAIFRSTH
ncbi:hypothetical protein H072_9089 [Dactylellina haptotyla CBS 200.50]|uniref:Uncharacterized protein n=1 Tax=Dactylellina haptotyla (strain CBS 200.50) TaxID=1284197 RepID=S8BDK3_DACHA|nr:hypothetical protein H072_9089 [Dactylellina haptotyla CBS 200.50]